MSYIKKYLTTALPGINLHFESFIMSSGVQIGTSKTYVEF